MHKVLAVLAVIMGVGMAEAQTHKGYETPAYTVEQAEGAVEVRLYERFVLAEVTVAGERRAAIGRGFRILAGYIFGGNAAGEKVAMTVPVAQRGAQTAAQIGAQIGAEAGGESEWVVQFMMPRAFSLATLPRPKDARIRFEETAPTRQAVIRFSGLATAQALATQEKALRDWAAAQGIALGAGPRYYFYDDPMTLPWNRRNEVAFVVK